MSRPFRWDLTKREQLGRLVDGPAAEAYREFMADLRRCCARILAFCGDSDLFFPGREPGMRQAWYRALIGEVRFARSEITTSSRDRERPKPPPGFFLVRPDLPSKSPGWLLDSVRLASKHVAEKAQWVQVNSKFIPAYAASLPLDAIARPEHDPATHYLGHGDDTLAFFITLDSINFGSGYFPFLRKRPGMSGYFTIASSLNDHFREFGPFSAKALTEVTTEDCMRIFGQDPENKYSAELMQHFTKALNALGHYLLESMGGSFVCLVESAQRSAERLVLLLVDNMQYFRDIAFYRGVWVPFLKRAQLTAADLYIAFGGQGPGQFDDLDRLTIFADNLVPHVLRMDGVLVYDDWLLKCVDNGWGPDSGEPEEVEIRACALHAVELIVQELRKQGRAVNAMQLDYLLWNRGQLPRYKARPRHRAKSVYY